MDTVIGAGNRVGFDISVDRIVTDLIERIQPNKIFKRDMKYLMKDTKPIKTIVQGLMGTYIWQNLKSRFNIDVPFIVAHDVINIVDMTFDDFNQLESFKIEPNYAELYKYKREIDTLISEVIVDGSN